MSSPVLQTNLDPDEEVDLKTLIAQAVAEPDTWIVTPNDQLGWQRPVDLFGTDRERLVRDLARSIKVGMFT